MRYLNLAVSRLGACEQSVEVLPPYPVGSNHIPVARFAVLPSSANQHSTLKHETSTLDFPQQHNNRHDREL